MLDVESSMVFDNRTSVDEDRDREYMRMDEEGEMDPFLPIGPKLHFHMQIDERISNNFCSRHSLLVLYPHNHDSFHKIRGAKACLGPLRLPGQHLYDEPLLRVNHHTNSHRPLPHGRGSIPPHNQSRPPRRKPNNLLD